MGREEFVNIYGGIYEQSPWVAEQAWDREGNPPSARLAALFESCVTEKGFDKLVFKCQIIFILIKK